MGNAKIREQQIWKVSGGQQKRVSIALELLAKPNIFYLDEPTSSLDPGLDRSIMSMLRTLVLASLRGWQKEEFSLTQSEYPMMVSKMEGEMEGDGQCFLQRILLYL